MEIQYLSPEELIIMHQSLLLEFGGMGGITEAGFTRLENAAYAPRQSMFGTDLYPDLPTKAAALVYGIIRNHPFSDGNKRTALVALAVLLELNGATLTATNDEAYNLALAVAADMTRAELTTWIAAHM
ncbi:MAG: type II toxin-antitoxin system death-on-curing family toxin [Chloroflexaceae bacterium]|nr:type II toxin-antitoxin system death-on-curing family toxin [Chloroflexaceae bacterium]NJL33726.1 type II toxin-antitoxin system death-on-curing family toxin [Chloroflexaceae bacterium]